MKRFPQIDRFFTAVFSFLILAIFVLLTSCEKDSLQDDYLRVKSQKIKTASLRTLNTYNDCDTNCIIEGSESYYVKSGLNLNPMDNKEPSAIMLTTWKRILL